MRAKVSPGILADREDCDLAEFLIDGPIYIHIDQYKGYGAMC
jgi:hypothetical protein|tara:strand:+ start:257 stop:382 length:126 start_codon:yes stop_codon:yes gene_type:complete